MKAAAIFIAALFALVGMALAFTKGLDLHPLARLVLFGASLWAYSWLFDFDERRVAHELDEANGPRFDELARLVRAGRFELAVKGTSFFGWSLLALAMGAAMLLPGVMEGDLAIILSAIIVLCFGVLGLLRGIPDLGKPVIVLSTEGFSTPQIPFTPWSLVDGVHLQAIEHRDKVSGYVLSFHVESLPQLIRRAGPFYRLAHLLRRGDKRKAIGMPLRATSEHPEVLYRLARLLWTRATGLDHVWDPFMSDAENLAIRQALEKPFESLVILAREGRRRFNRGMYWMLGLGGVVALYFVLQVFLREVFR